MIDDDDDNDDDDDDDIDTDIVCIGCADAADPILSPVSQSALTAPVRQPAHTLGAHEYS